MRPCATIVRATNICSRHSGGGKRGMARFRDFALFSAKLNLSLFLAVSIFMLLVSTSGGVAVASAQNAGEIPAAKLNTSKPKDLIVSRKKVNFGSVPPYIASASQVVTIHNPNSIAVDVSWISSSSGEFVASNKCVTSMAAHGYCDVSIVFTPSSYGKKSADLTISSTGSKSLSVEMTGEGKGAPVPTPTVAPTLTPTPTPTSTATPTPTSTATPTTTATPIPATCPSPGAGACPSSGPASISSLIPSSAVAGGPGLPLAVCGCNLTASTTVEWNSVPRTTSFVSSNQVNASVLAADVAGVGVDQVAVSANSQVSAPETFLVGSTGGAGYAELEIDQQSNGMVYDPVNQVIYLSVPGNAPTNGNTISVISLAMGMITSSAFAGSEPDAIAISDDSQFLYAGIDGSSKVQRFKLPSLDTDISYSLGRSSFFGPNVALDLQVAPGAPHTTAVSLGNFGFSPEAQGGIVIFDDSTPRPTTSPGWTGSTNLYDSLQWGSDATALYAANYEDTAWDFYTLAVSPAGVVQTHDYPNTFSKFDFEIHFDSGTNLIYSDEGHVVDPLTGNPVGEFVVGNGVIVPDSILNRAFFASQTTGTLTIQAFNLQKFSLIDSITIPNVSGFPNRIIRWGNNGLAVSTSGGPVYLIGGNFVH